MGLISPGGENLLDFLEMRQVLSTYDRDLIPRDMGSIPGSGRSPGVGNGNPLHYFCQENSMGRGAWMATVHGVAKSRT